jgi:hypothetical protein
MNLFPSIDAHFWVERDGEIIDPDFKEFDIIGSVWDCDTKDKKYIPAPEMTQKIMIEQYYRVLKYRMKIDNIDEVIQKFYIGSKRREFPRYNCCFQNAIIEIAKNGGKLVFGSMGFKKYEGGYHYEWGGEDYKTIGDFRGTSKAVEKIKENLRGRCNVEEAIKVILGDSVHSKKYLF